MRVGVFYFPTDYGIDIGELAHALEARGFESLFLPEHTHIPVSRRTPFPSGGELPRRYAHTHDPFVALSFAAAATKNLRLGTGICLIPERDPIVTAKEVASLDQLSGGRFEFGIGAGWNREEMRNHGTNPRTRMRLMAEQLAAMKTIWTQEEASYQGEFVTFERIWSWPKPAQRPHPPVLVGGNGPTVLDRVLAFGDAWFPNFARGGGDIVERAQALWARADRTIDVMVMGVPADAAVLERLEAGGCRRVVHWLPSAAPAGLARALEGWESAIAELTGEA